MQFHTDISHIEGLTANEPVDGAPTAPFDYPKTPSIPMMQARRMSLAAKLACEVFIRTLKSTKVDAAIFLSEHGELERSFNVIKHIAQGEGVSPTDFSMSVHNTAAGLATILTQSPIEVTSIAGGKDGFIHALYEVMALQHSGHHRIALIAFDGQVPSFYETYGATLTPAYAVAMVFSKGSSYAINCTHSEQQTLTEPLPLMFWRDWQADPTNITLRGQKLTCHIQSQA
ncbi:hypothetical protein B9T21_04245 [Wohlfahrtiimonas chitiniclastica]|uniref:beta-ketoacyl synthase chain length factor n=1 Tax=Wohlfahrtiimonas chitiniclastica TaxID=400946 RepID=UPI000B99C1CE|nr:beta-ketoacyl synthase chain length factor [Wohlfahrtiimonas chitiniclastica]OYQ88511.1 hypothetical protein B9T21_04245 [Wohlfahrtiimonas chitiniclastica]